MKALLANKSFLFIMFTAFLSVIGIGIIIPEIPYIVEKYLPHASPSEVALYVGLLTSIYSVCQFFAAPGLGALSDRFGRRPVLLSCLLGSAFGYLLFGIGGSITVLFIGRIIDGLTGGDIGAIFSYIADVTKPEERGKMFGIIGAVVGIGFMIGPSIGGLVSLINISAPFYLAAALTLLNMLFGYFVLPESLAKEHRTSDFSLHHLNPFLQITKVLSDVTIRTILLIGFLYFLPFSLLQGIGGVFSKDVLHWAPATIGIFFSVVGFVDIITQGVLSGKLLHKFGETKLVIAGLIVTGIAYLFNSLLIFFPITLFAFISVIIYALGSGLIEPALGGIISRVAGPKQQGTVQGANQSLQSLTRIAGPLIAAYLYSFSPGLPYFICAIFSLIALIYVVNKWKFLNDHLAAEKEIFASQG